MKTTLNKIRAHSPCTDGWKKLLNNLSKTEADDEPLLLTTILESNGLDDTLWCLRAVDGHEREMRLFAVACARRVQHWMTDKRSLDALDVAEKFANGQATQEELTAAWSAAMAAGRAAESGAASDAASDAAAWAPAWAAMAARAAMAAASAARAAAGAARAARAAGAARAAAEAAMAEREAQAALFILMCEGM
jgi:hypothetical protein